MPLLNYISVLQINVSKCVTACFLPTAHKPSHPPALVLCNSYGMSLNSLAGKWKMPFNRNSEGNNKREFLEAITDSLTNNVCMLDSSKLIKFCKPVFVHKKTYILSPAERTTNGNKNAK